MLILKMKKLRPRGKNHTRRSPSSLGLDRPRLRSAGAAGHQIPLKGRNRALVGAAPAAGLPPAPPAQGVLSLLPCFLIAWKQS